MVLSGYDASQSDCWEVVKDTHPRTVNEWGAADLAEWLEEAKFLIVIEDFVLKDDAAVVRQAMEEWENAAFMLTTTPYDAVGLATLLSESHAVLSLSLVGLDQCDVISSAAQCLPPSELEPFTSWLIGNWCICEDVCSYPALLELLCYAWSSRLITDEVITKTQLVWVIVECQMSRHSGLPANVLGDWLRVLARLNRRSLETKRLMNRLELEREAQQVFPGSLAEEMVTSFLPVSCSAASPSVLSLPHPMTQFLAGWDAIHQNIHGTPMKALTKYMVDEDPVVLYVAGHLDRLLLYQTEISEKQVSRVAKNLILHMDRAKDQFGYTLRVLQEVRLEPRILRIVTNEVAFPKVWEVNDAAILPEPLTALLRCSTPSKVQIVVEKRCCAPDLQGVVLHLSTTAIPIFLADMNQLVWDTPDTADGLIMIIQKGTMPLHDFIGCLSSTAISNLGNAATTKNLVCLRVKVRDKASVQAIFKYHSSLPCLMWLEIDFDLLLNDLDPSQVSQVNTPLMDVCFKDIQDQDIPFLCDYLARVRKRYSGVHLTRSSLTPQGATDLLKIFFTKGMIMTADANVIKRYRRWRFPSLANVPLTEELTDEKVSHLLGYDDRYHYSDNEVRSSALTNRVDAGALANFFTIMTDLVFFRYICANFSVIKNTDGSTEVKELL